MRRYAGVGSLSPCTPCVSALSSLPEAAAATGAAVAAQEASSAAASVSSLLRGHLHIRTACSRRGDPHSPHILRTRKISCVLAAGASGASCAFPVETFQGSNIAVVRLCLAGQHSGRHI